MFTEKILLRSTQVKNLAAGSAGWGPLVIESVYQGGMSITNRLKLQWILGITSSLASA